MKKFYHFEKNTILNKKLSELVSLSLNSLEEMYLPKTYEFAKRKFKIANEVKIDGKSLRYTLINLIGLQKAKEHGYEINIDLNQIIEFHIRNVNKFKSLGDIGLLLWAASLISPNSLLNILPKINLVEIFATYKESKTGNTMELSWFLIGLIFASTFNDKFKSSIDILPTKVYHKLRGNYGGHGIFKHENTSSLEGKIRSNIGTLADQIYSIYAFSLYSKIMVNEEALLIANECADNLCRHQSIHGEWKWQYDSSNGEVVNNYPIFPVHQLSLVPMALFSIQMSSKKEYFKNIFSSIEWLTENDQIYDMVVDESNNAIWDKITPIINNKLNSLLSFSGFNTFDNRKLKIHYECSSYIFGLILYIFSGRIDKTDKQISKNDILVNTFQVFELNHMNSKNNF
ncbi:MAG: hypothetical protein H6610_10120 [Ignavibacteriales bacterium]|nr:hypothetical protein [Ignavibacteriales bacterium]